MLWDGVEPGGELGGRFWKKQGSYEDLNDAKDLDMSKERRERLFQPIKNCGLNVKSNMAPLKVLVQILTWPKLCF